MAFSGSLYVHPRLTITPEYSIFNVTDLKLYIHFMFSNIASVDGSIVCTNFTHGRDYLLVPGWRFKSSGIMHSNHIIYDCRSLVGAH